MELLLQQETLNKDARTWAGLTALNLSLYHKVEDDIVLLLINAGCDVTIGNNENVTPLHFAVKRNTSVVAHALLKAGAHIDAIDFDGFAPIHEAIISEAAENIYMLLYYNPDMEIRSTFYHCTPFMMSMHSNLDDFIIELLMEYSTNYNSIYHTGESILFMALKNKKLIASELVKRGANVNFALHKCSCLKMSSMQQESTLFNLIWSVQDFNKLVQNDPQFLCDFFHDCAFATPIYLEIIFRILSCPVAHLLAPLVKLEKASKALDSRNIDESTKYSIIYALLSMGAEITFKYLNYIYNKYGFDDHFETLIKWNTTYELYNFPCNPNTVFYIICHLKENLQNILNRSFDNHYTVMTKKYFTLPSIVKVSRRCIPGIPDNVPSLLELSRNVIRKKLAENHNPCKAFGYIQVVESLGLPKPIQDIIVLKTPIYS